MIFPLFSPDYFVASHRIPSGRRQNEFLLQQKQFSFDVQIRVFLRLVSPLYFLKSPKCGQRRESVLRFDSLSFIIYFITIVVVGRRNLVNAVVATAVVYAAVVVISAVVFVVVVVVLAVVVVVVEGV